LCLQLFVLCLINGLNLVFENFCIWIIAWMVGLSQTNYSKKFEISFSYSIFVPTHHNAWLMIYFNKKLDSARTMTAGLNLWYLCFMADVILRLVMYDILIRKKPFWLKNSMRPNYFSRGNRNVLHFLNHQLHINLEWKLLV